MPPPPPIKHLHEHALYRETDIGLKIRITAITYAKYYKNKVSMEKIEFQECSEF